jgi:hypothetical protein
MKDVFYFLILDRDIRGEWLCLHCLAY